MTVKATREGLYGCVTASGFVIDKVVPFVALPSTRALGRAVRVTYHDKSCVAIVLDVGPWNEHDDAYVWQGQRPQAECGTDTFGRKTNSAGIDLGEKVWKTLGLTDNDLVDWEFV